jgi:hypothetical protein
VLLLGVTVAIQLDQHPQEIGWRIDWIGSSVDEVDEVVQVVQVPAGFYRNPSVLETQTVFLEKGEFYTFTIFDTTGDGLCCDYGEGKYQVSLGTNDISDTSAIIIESEGVFQFGTAHVFLASVHNDELCKGPGSSCSFMGLCDDCCNEASCSFSGCKCL